MIRVNDDPLEWHDGMTVLEVLRLRNFKFPLLIITIDGTFIPKSDYGKALIHDGAEVKVVHLISGG
jgi:thiamine biosynthesis protein ThiS